MEKDKKLTMRVPQGLLNPEILRVKQIQDVEEKRFENIAQQILEILIKEKVLVREIPRVVSIMTNKINQKIDNFSVDSIIIKI